MSEPINSTPPNEKVPPKPDEHHHHVARRMTQINDEVVKVFHSSEAKQAMGYSSPIVSLQDWVEQRSKRKAAQKQQRVDWLALLKYSNRREKWIMATGLFMALISGLCLPAWLVLLANGLNRFSSLANIIQNAPGGNNEGLFQVVRNELDQLIIGFALLGVVSLFSGSTYVGLWTYTGEQQALRIKEKYVQSALKQDATFFDLHNRDKIPTEVANAMVHINSAIGRQMADTWSNFWTSMGCLIVAFLLNLYLALIMMCMVPVAAICIAVVACFIRKNAAQASDQFASAGALATEVIAGIKTVASLRAEKWALTSYQGLVRGAQKSSVYSGFLAGLSAGITGMLFYIIYTVAFAFGTYQVAERSDLWTLIGCFIGLDLGDDCSINGASVMCCIYGVILCATFFGMMAPGLNAVNQGRQAAVGIFETIERVPEIDASSTEGQELPKFAGGIEFKDVDFSYPSRPKDTIFQDFNLNIKPGTSVALVGPSGSGKSTVARLLLRFYDPTRGQLLIDGVPMPSLNLQWWRSQIGYVPQEPILFPGTMTDNIRLGQPDATDEQVVAAAKAACAHEFIVNMPQGYDTFFSGASIQLSGGQLQRICIARAMIRNPAVLLLDEATSALDTDSERQVQMAVENIRQLKQMTTVTIAHRLSTIVSSDQIAVISDGNIAELGTHKSLLEQGGIYANLCESQGITLESLNQPEPEAVEYQLQDTKAGLAVSTKKKDIEEGIEEEDESVKKEDEEEPELEELASVSRLWALNKPDKWYLLMGTLGSMVVGALPPSESILTAQIVANFYVEGPDTMMAANRKYILGFIVFAVAALVGNLTSACGLSVSGYRLTRRLRVLAFEAIVRRSMGWFDVPEHSVGELCSRLEGDAEAVAKVTGWSLGYRIRVMTSLMTGVIIALIYSWQIGLTAIACVPLVMGPAFLQRCCLSKRYALQRDGLSPSTILEQALRGINAIQAYNLQDTVFEQYSEALVPEKKGKTRKGVIAGLVFGLSQCSIFCSFAIVFWVGSELLTQNKVDFVGFFTPVLAVMFGAVAVAQVNADFNSRQDGQAAAARIFKIVDEPLDDKDPFRSEGQKPSSLSGAIQYEAVSFAYPTRPDNKIFYPSEGRDGFSLALKPKESVGFVGKSGAGKSTALQILLRFYDATAGSVRLDKCDVRDLNIGWLRGNIGYVGQMPVLFAGTVRDNILLGKQDATEEQIVNAAKAANAHDFVMEMNQGYDTDIGSGGSRLSGGQRQRLAIARAIVSDPDILILDEATAALDNESQRIVQDALDDLQSKNPRTTLVVAHRLSTIKRCDQIVVLGGGGVKELGTHDSLLNSKGLYHELWMKQVGSTKEE